MHAAPFEENLTISSLKKKTKLLFHIYSKTRPVYKHTVKHIQFLSHNILKPPTLVSLISMQLHEGQICLTQQYVHNLVTPAAETHATHTHG